MDKGSDKSSGIRSASLGLDFFGKLLRSTSSTQCQTDQRYQRYGPSFCRPMNRFQKSRSRMKTTTTPTNQNQRCGPSFCRQLLLPVNERGMLSPVEVNRNNPRRPVTPVNVNDPRVNDPRPPPHQKQDPVSVLAQVNLPMSPPDKALLPFVFDKEKKGKTHKDPSALAEVNNHHNLNPTFNPDNLVDDGMVNPDHLKHLPTLKKKWGQKLEVKKKKGGKFEKLHTRRMAKEDDILQQNGKQTNPPLQQVLQQFVMPSKRELKEVTPQQNNFVELPKNFWSMLLLASLTGTSTASMDKIL